MITISPYYLFTTHRQLMDFVAKKRFGLSSYDFIGCFSYLIFTEITGLLSLFCKELKRQ